MAEEATVEEQLAALRLQVQSLQAQQQQQPQPLHHAHQIRGSGRPAPALATVPITPGVPVLTQLSELPHSADNPIQRTRAAPITVGELDLKQDR